MATFLATGFRLDAQSWRAATKEMQVCQAHHFMLVQAHQMCSRRCKELALLIRAQLLHHAS